MTEEFDELQKLVMADMKKIYTETVIDHAMNPRNIGEMEDADGFAKVLGPCGDTMRVWLKVESGTVVAVTFLTDGCVTSVVAGSMSTELVKGKSIFEALRISQQDVLDALGGLPEDGIHCALLAANTLKEAAKNYFTLSNEPWKKVYRQH